MLPFVRVAAYVVTTLRVTARAAREVTGLPEGPERWRLAAEGQSRGAREALAASGVEVETVGAVPDRPVLYVANHFGLLDGWICAAALRFAIVGKGEVLGWPAVGFVARTFAMVSVDRERRSTTSGFVERIHERLAAGVSVLVFAEGTTTDGMGLGPFKTGAFEAVVGTGVPVVPVFQSVEEDGGGAVRDRRPYSWVNESLGTSLRRVFRQRPRRAVVRLGAPIPSEGETRKTLAAKTRAAVAALDPLGQGVQA